MTNKINIFIKPHLKKDLPDIRTGDMVKVYQKIKEDDKERTYILGGIVIARKHGREMGATITVRKVVSGVGVEKVFPINSPTIEKIEVLRRGKARRAKLYYLREAKGKRAKLKLRREGLVEAAPEEEPTEKTTNE